MVDISVVIPVYGCKGAINELYERLSKSLIQITNKYEIIFVDDCCPQDSWKYIEKKCKEDSRVVGIKLSRNFGQMKAILAGLDNCCGEWIVVMDCDLQDSPEEIINLYNEARKGFDIVFSKRRNRKDNALKIFISKIFYKLYSYLTDDYYDPAINNFCICSKRVIENYCKMREWHRAFTIYLKWLGFNYSVIEVEHNSRKEGKSSYSFRKRIKLATDILLSQSDKILRIIVKTGFITSIISTIWAIVVLCRYFMFSITAGWTSIIIVLCILGGLILAAIGCVGIYVGNTFMQTKNRPLYITDKIINIKREG